MANSKISALSSKATPVGADTLYIVDSSDTSSKKTTLLAAMAMSGPALTAPTITTSIKPTSDDGAPIGDTTHNFSDLFLATGAVINYQNGNVVLTHTSGVITMGTGDLRITTAGTNAASVVTVGGTQTLTNKTITAPTISDVSQSGLIRRAQGAPAAKTTSTTLTGAEVIGGIITVNQGGGAASALQLPTGSNIEAAISPALATGDSFDLSIINISTVGAEDASVTTNTGLTLVGDMNFSANDAVTARSSGILRFRKTASNTFSVYRLA